MDQSEDGYGNQGDGIEELYAKPYKLGRKKPAPDMSNQSDGIYDRLDRQNSTKNRNRSLRRDGSTINGSMHDHDDISMPEAQNLRNNQPSLDNLGDNSGDVYDDAALEASGQRSLASQSISSNVSEESNKDSKPYQSDLLEAKDTNEIIKELKEMGLEDQSARLALALRARFDLENAFIDVCSDDGVVIVEGDYDDESSGHQSIGGLRVKGMKPNFVNYDEYDPDIIKKYGYFAQGFSREKMANDAADLRRHAANMLWTVENMERMIDPNSRVRYVRQENGE
eukprot:gene377-10041_t